MSRSDTSTVPAAQASGHAARRLVLRNTMFLVVAQIVATPLSLLVNVVAARTLGPDDFGQIYLAMTFAAFAFLFVEWGQTATLTAMVVKERPRAGEILASGLGLRACLLPAVVIGLFGICWLLGYPRSFLVVLGLVLLTAMCTTVSTACQDVFRGFERTDLGATSYVAWQLLTAAVVVPTLLLGGRLHAFLLAQAGCALIGALVLLRCLALVGITGVRPRRQTIKVLLATGTTFLVFNLVLALQTNIDAVFLSKLASAESIGWNAAARKLVGLLTFPATALIGALYPTLCRLHLDDAGAFGATARSALRMTVLAAMPVALGCALFPGIGIDLFGGRSYGPAQDNLRIMAVYVLLMYISMPTGATLVACGRQRAWTIVQFACVVVSVIFDPLLIPWFQNHTGNGGLGVCVTTVGSEVLMVAGGLWLLPRGVLDRSLGRTFGAVVLAGAAMAAIAWALSGIHPYLAATLAVLGYAVCIGATGEVDRAQLATLKSLLKKKTAGASGGPA